MWIKSAGELGDNSEQISTSVSTHVLVKSDRTALFDVSVWGLRQELADAISVSTDTLDYVFITHAHFDHLGAIPFLRQKFPNLKLAAGSDTVKQLSKESILEKTFTENRESALALGQEFSLSLNLWKDALKIEHVLNEGDEIDLGGGVLIKAIHTPGHTRDSMSYHVSPDGIIVTGDALGAYNGREFVTPSFSESYSDYLASIAKLEGLELKMIALAHSGILSGNLIGVFLNELVSNSKKIISEIQVRSSEGETAEDIAWVIAKNWEEEGKLPEGPFRELHGECVLGMVKGVLGSF
jgi:glyoxylase-like metal-dependent hydrolase (beta-lactamase superfamily II)